MVQRAPALYGLARSRWWLAGVQQTIAWLGPLSIAGVWQLLARLDIHYKRGRHYTHSPDLAYDDKLALIAQAYEAAWLNPQQVVFLYQDEFTYYRYPLLANEYGQAGHDDVRASLDYTKNRRMRLAACLDALTGRVLVQQATTFPVSTLLGFFRSVEAAYPLAKRIYVVLDNWPVHLHPTLLASLQHSKLVFLPLPTYAPWLNPTEKVWLKLCQDVLYLHRFQDDWLALQQRVLTWFDQFALGSPALLKFVGLLV
ncbi:MAG: IS630 family transposase [Anaerolineae bacterium]|nr:IS630 family transposase [Anaerolineae bacterium]